MGKKIFVTGIGTDVGKTICSSIIVKALNADYWKPIQAGDLLNSDTLKVKSLTNCKAFPEAYQLSEPMSPHAAAIIDNITIDLDQLNAPETDNMLVIEGAGGLMVPLNEEETILDLLKKYNYPTIVVSKNYLGSINHTLCTLTLLKAANIPVIGVLFNGEENSETERIIVKQGKVKNLGRIPKLKELSPLVIQQIAATLKLDVYK